MISKIIKEADLKLTAGNVIDLGYMNDWYYSKKINEAYNKLKEYTVEGTLNSETIANCVTRYSRKLRDGSESYTLVYTVDSSD